MFPQSIVIENPRTPRPGFGSGKGKVLLHRCNLIALWEQLHDPHEDFCGKGPFLAARAADMQTVVDWVCGRTAAEQLPPDLHIEQWRQLVKQLGRPPPANSSDHFPAAARAQECNDDYQ
jgi:2-polyprenyl-6-methoxyphenol hydroxylase-like FAD-dependent oxidoreductase